MLVAVLTIVKVEKTSISSPHLTAVGYLAGE